MTMTTHILIVDNQTFKQHLEYMFVGTGTARLFQFNNDRASWPFIHPSTERNLSGLVADCCRMREGDNIIFYLQQSENEGGFFGIFKVKKVPVGNFVAFTDKKGDTYPNLSKALQYRAFIEPYRVYEQGVTEWEALDDIKSIMSPFQMLWSLIYRKLKGNRGNTMITLYESDRLINLIITKNMGNVLVSPNGYSYNERTNRIVAANSSHYDFSNCVQLDISRRLLYKYNLGQSHETHLQAFITNNIKKGTCPSLDSCIFGSSLERLNWIGNEVSCGVGMQRMDVVLSTEDPGEQLNNLYVVELKCVPVEKEHIWQINRYIDWLTQYYIPNRQSKIIPVLISVDSQMNQAKLALINSEKSKFDNQYLGIINYAPLKLVYYSVNGNNLFFHI